MNEPAPTRQLICVSLVADDGNADMNWHLKPAWGGYTFDNALYPGNGTLLLDFLHGRGLATGANLHDHDGVLPVDERYAAVCQVLGIPPSAATIAFAPEDQGYMDALHNLVLEPLAAQGLDVWWTDYQQGLVAAPGLAGVNPTLVLNHYRFHNYSQPGSTRRGQIHSRFAGLGGHRYPTQFGGDVIQTWASLAFMPYFVATGANVGAAYWAMEMMNGQGSVIDRQLFTRVLQFGAWSPVFTTWGNTHNPNNLWSDKDFPEPFRGAVQMALAYRAMTLPYRYTAARHAYDHGLGIVRPSYYNYPDDEAAYGEASRHQFLVGDDLLVAPVYLPLAGCAPIDHNCSAGASTQAVWFPPADGWVPAFPSSPNLTAGEAAAGLRNVTSTLAEVPVYARAGSVVPMLPYASAIAHGSAARPFTELQFVVYRPAAAPQQRGYVSVYEDDGMSNDYQAAQPFDRRGTGNTSGGGAFVNISMHWWLNSSGCIAFNVSAAGTYAGAPQQRQYSVHVVDAGPLERCPRGLMATVNGLSLAFAPSAGPAGTALSVHHRLPAGEVSLRLPVSPVGQPQLIGVCCR